jgi:hypothetical protein
MGKQDLEISKIKEILERVKPCFKINKVRIMKIQI